MPPFKHFKESEIIGLQIKLVQMLELAREIAKIPFIITSGVRTEEHNKKVGGVPNSSHTKGLAVDLKCNDSRTRFLIISSLMQAGFKRIGAESDHVHADIDALKDQNVLWRVDP